MSRRSPVNSQKSIQKSVSRFAELLQYELSNGTRPKGLNNIEGGWTDTIFAKKIGFSHTSVKNWRTGRTRPRQNHLTAILKALFGTDLDHPNRLELIRAHAALWQVDELLSKAGEGDAFEAKVESCNTVERSTESVKSEAIERISNVPQILPRHFQGRDTELTQLDKTLAAGSSRSVIVALHGLQGVGKTILAAAYAELYRDKYRIIWWIRAETSFSMIADLISLGSKIEELTKKTGGDANLTGVLRYLSENGQRILLIYDNAINADSLKPYLVQRGASQALITSNDHAWRGVAEPVEIYTWSKLAGGAYLVARTGWHQQLAEAERLSELLEGLPLAHEQAAAYCEKIEINFTEYARRFQENPIRYLDDEYNSSADYHYEYYIRYKHRLTILRTFELAMLGAEGIQPSSKNLIRIIAVLPSEVIPDYLLTNIEFSSIDRRLSSLSDLHFSEAVAALRAFSLVFRENIEGKQDQNGFLKGLRLHRLVREVAASKISTEARNTLRQKVLQKIAGVYVQIHHEYRKKQNLESLEISILIAIILDLLRDSIIEKENNKSLFIEIIFLVGTWIAKHKDIRKSNSDLRMLWDRGLDLALRNLQKEDRLLLRQFGEVGIGLLSLGMPDDIPKAIDCLERALHGQQLQERGICKVEMIKLSWCLAVALSISNRREDILKSEIVIQKTLEMVDQYALESSIREAFIQNFMLDAVERPEYGGQLSRVKCNHLLMKLTLATVRLKKKMWLHYGEEDFDLFDSFDQEKIYSNFNSEVDTIAWISVAMMLCYRGTQADLAEVWLIFNNLLLYRNSYFIGDDQCQSLVLMQLADVFTKLGNRRNFLILKIHLEKILELFELRLGLDHLLTRGLSGVLRPSNTRI